MNAPCRGCPDREVGCHAGCELYKAYRAERDRMNEEKRVMSGIEWQNPAKARAARKKLNSYKRQH